MFRRLFESRKKREQREAAEYEAWYEAKSDYFTQRLGPEHDMVMHALIPYAIGGGLDLYYYPQHPAYPGTAIATKELVEQWGRGPSNRAYPAYEWVAFTRHALDLDVVKEQSEHPFAVAHDRMNRLLNAMARFTEHAQLNAAETCEFPADYDEHLGGACLILDAFSPPAEANEQGVGLMLVIEVFRDEMQWAREHGGSQLIDALKRAEHYPYLDLDRDPVV